MYFENPLPPPSPRPSSSPPPRPTRGTAPSRRVGLSQEATTRASSLAGKPGSTRKTQSHSPLTSSRDRRLQWHGPNAGGGCLPQAFRYSALADVYDSLWPQSCPATADQTHTNKHQHQHQHHQKLVVGGRYLGGLVGEAQEGKGSSGRRQQRRWLDRSTIGQQAPIRRGRKRSHISHHICSIGGAGRQAQINQYLFCGNVGRVRREGQGIRILQEYLLTYANKSIICATSQPYRTTHPYIRHSSACNIYTCPGMDRHYPARIFIGTCRFR